MKPVQLIKTLSITACLVLGLAAFTGCAAATNTAVSPSNTTATTGAASNASTYTDAFAYCGAVGSIDQPDARYSGPRMPEDVARGLMKASGASADAPLDVFVANSFWRCMDGKVMACFVGANLPCESKANTDKTPTAAETEYCAANPSAEFIPAAVTGHETVYEWACKDGQPEATRQVLQVDARGYIADFWYPIEKP